MSSPRCRHPRLAADAALWASAAVLAGLLIAQTGQRAGNPARAEMVSAAGGYVILTTQGQNDELLYVIDNLTENLFVYETEQAGGLVLLHKEHLPDVFAAARAAAGP